MTNTHTALLLIDLQRWIVGRDLAPSLGTEIAAQCARLRESLARSAATIIFVRHLRSDGADGGALAPANDWTTEIAPNPGDSVVTKDGLDAFAGTDLAELLTTRGIHRVVIAGIATEHGVAVTARTAARLGFETQVVQDAVTGLQRAGHQAALSSLATAGIQLVHAESYLSQN